MLETTRGYKRYSEFNATTWIKVYLLNIILNKNIELQIVFKTTGLNFFVALTFKWSSRKVCFWVCFW